ncbi:MAG: hypothetical protein ABIZ50_05955 [Solirubrobacterales bacterium]
MRPVNLIPPEERRGESAPTRSGPLAYLVVGALVLVLAAVIGVVLSNKRVDDRKAEASAVEARASEAQAHAESLSAFASFQGIHDARVATVDGLAKSRFDWGRVLRELSRVTPRNIWLTQLVGTVTPEVSLEGGGDATGLRANVPGPALELTGCGRSQSDVARLAAAMEDIDGVTRVTVSDSAKSDVTASASSGSSAAPTAGGSCQTRSTIPEFNLIAAFDEVAGEASAPAASVAPSAPATTTPAPAPAATAPPPADGTPSAPQQQRIDTAAAVSGGG